MAKIESSLTNMLLVLVVITVVSGGVLGAVYTATKAPIKAAKLAKQKKAISFVVPGFTNNPIDEMYKLPTQLGFELKVFPCKKDDKLIGSAIETMTKNGFNGNIRIMVGLKPDGTIINYKVLEHAETPGLGSKMDAWFRTNKNKQSVLGVNPKTTKLIVSKDGGDVDAITAATISSRAFLDALSTACKTYSKSLKNRDNNSSNNEGGEK